MSERFLNTQQVADRLNISEYTCRKWMRQGILRAIHLGRAWKMTESELVRFMTKERER